MQELYLVVFHKFFAARAEKGLSKAGLFIYITTFQLIFLQKLMEISGNIISHSLRKLPYYAPNYAPASLYRKVAETPEIPVEKSKFSTLSTGFSTRVFCIDPP